MLINVNQPLPSPSHTNNVLKTKTQAKQIAVIIQLLVWEIVDDHIRPASHTGKAPKTIVQ